RPRARRWPLCPDSRSVSATCGPRGIPTNARGTTWLRTRARIARNRADGPCPPQGLPLDSAAMDEQPPAPDQPTPPMPYEAGTDAYEPVTPASRASRARVTALILAILVVLTGGGTALLLRASNKTQSLDRFVPDTVAAYVKFSLQPSVEQKQKVGDLLSRFPS